MSFIKQAWEFVTPWKNTDREICAGLTRATGMLWKSENVVTQWAMEYAMGSEMHYSTYIKDVKNPEQLAADILEELNQLSSDGSEIFEAKIKSQGIGLGHITITLKEPNLHKIDTSKSFDLDPQIGHGFVLQDFTGGQLHM